MKLYRNLKSGLFIILILLLLATVFIVSNFYIQEGATLSRRFSRDMVVPWPILLTFKAILVLLSGWMMIFILWVIYCDLFKRIALIEVDGSGIKMRRFLLGQKSYTFDQFKRITTQNRQVLGQKFISARIYVGDDIYGINGSTLTAPFDVFERQLREFMSGEVA